MRQIETFTDIDAPPQAVWDILTNFAAYGRWNPFIPNISGIPAEGKPSPSPSHPRAERR